MARQVKNKIRYPVRKLGAEKLKNISMPMDVYCIQLPWLNAAKKNPVTFAWRSMIPYGLAFLAAFLAVSFFFYLRKSQGRMGFRQVGVQFQGLHHGGFGFADSHFPGDMAIAGYAHQGIGIG